MRNPALCVKWSSAACDLSGYASASRNHIHALLEVGVDVSLDVRTFEPWAPQYLKDEVMGRKLYSIVGKDNGAKIHIIHHTPDLMQDYNNPYTKKICMFAWETDKIPEFYLKRLNSIPCEIWVPSEYIRQACLNSGVITPVYVIPHPVPLPDKEYSPVSYINNLTEGVYSFYSVFQFSERKNPINLLKAYMEEFSRSEPVVLVIKTYRKGNSIEERNYIRRQISKIKLETKGVNSPRLLLIEDFLTPKEMTDLHYHCNCNITMARSEGFGLPTFEAMSFGNPVIAPNYSAFKDFLNNNIAYPVQTNKEINVCDMSHISLLYTNDMLWGDPDIEHCKKIMRYIFENQQEAKDKGILGQKYIEENFSRKKIGKLMKERIEALL